MTEEQQNDVDDIDPVECLFDRIDKLPEEVQGGIFMALALLIRTYEQGSKLVLVGSDENALVFAQGFNANYEEATQIVTRCVRMLEQTKQDAEDNKGRMH